MSTNLIRTLPVKLTDEEKLTLAAKLAQMNLDIGQLMEEKANLPAKIKTLQSEAANIAKEFQEGKTEKQVECYWILDDPEPGLKTLCRSDTDEIIGHLPMALEFQETVNDKANDEEYVDIPVTEVDSEDEEI